MDEVTKAYVAGVMDCDGSFMIVGRPDGKRFEPRVAVAQVTPQVPEFMKAVFGGDIQYQVLEPPKRSRYMWRVSCTGATDVCRACLDYLQIKKDRAETLLSLWALKDDKLKSYAYWYELDHPHWRSELLIDTVETQQLLGYRNFYSVKQSIKMGVLLALPGAPGRKLRRIPKDMVLWLAAIKADIGKARLPTVPPGLVDLRRGLWLRMKELNKTGC